MIEITVAESYSILARCGSAGLRRRCQEHRLILVRLVTRSGNGCGRAAIGSHLWPTTKPSLRPLG